MPEPRRYAVAPDFAEKPHVNRLAIPPLSGFVFRVAIHVRPDLRDDVEQQARIVDDQGSILKPEATTLMEDPPLVAMDFVGLSKDRRYTLEMPSDDGPVRIFENVQGSDLLQW